MTRARTKPSTPFWVISFQLHKKKRWYLSPTPEYDDWWQVNKAQLYGWSTTPIQWPSPHPVFTYDAVPVLGGITDTTQTIPGGFIVSDRLRAFFDTEAPGALAFYPIRLQGPGSDKLPPYFALHFLNVWDCLHPYAWDEDENGRYVAFPVLDPDKLPADGLIGCVKDFGVEWLIHDSLKLKIKKLGFTGFDFYQRAPVATRDDIVGFKHVNHPRNPKGPGGGAIDSSPTYPKPKSPRSSPSNRKKSK